MQTVEELKALAEGAGLATSVKSSLDPADEGARLYSICVAAPSYSQDQRYRPFSLRNEEASAEIEQNTPLLKRAARGLGDDGLMFIYGLPAHLARYATLLSSELVFRYWIALRTVTANKQAGLRPEHTGLALLSKPGAKLNRVRAPHARCRHCQETLKDWGGKSHLMHPEGAALSDVWMDLVVNPSDRLPPEVLERVLQLSAAEHRDRLLLLLPEPARVPAVIHQVNTAPATFNPLRLLRGRPSLARERRVPDELINRLHRAPCLDVLKAIPSETVDLAFADPPFNLTKDYNGYSDDLGESDYTGRSKRWLVEYERVLKPGGALFLLNLPKWSFWLAEFLSRTNSLFLQNWIVWNSLPEPKGVLMPAHYSLLYFTKGERAARFNYCSMENGWEPFDEAVFPPDRADLCRRRHCVKKRRASVATWRGELTDIWHDIHRDRVASRRQEHPCATPEMLLDRIVRLATNPGDVVLDAFAGTGTSALVAQRLNRRFIAIEQDDKYVDVAEHRIGQLGKTRPRPARAARRNRVSKRRLQIELKRLAVSLGRLPSRADVRALSLYDLQLFDDAFASWNVALKAARTVADEAGLLAAARSSLAPRWQQLELFETQRPAGAITSEALNASERGSFESSRPPVWDERNFDTAFLIS